MRKWIALVESAEVDYLYHATELRNAEACMRDGVHAPSYWATEDVVSYYAEVVADEGHEVAILCAPISDFDVSLLEPDYPGIEEPLTYTLSQIRRERVSEEDIWQEWQASGKTWSDSLEIVGSVRYRGVIRPTQDS